MDWTLVALSQMFLVTVGVSIALGLRIRGVNKLNGELREHAEVVNESIATLEANQNPSPKEWVAEKVEGLDAEDPHTPLLKLVLEHAAKKNRKFAKELPDAVAACGLVAASEGGEAGVSEDQSEDLKNLLQQFTKDSREMMACIQSLEKENASLREQLGLDDNDAPAADTTPAPEAATTAASSDDADNNDRTTETAPDAPEPDAESATDEAEVAEDKAESDTESENSIEDPAATDEEAADQSETSDEVADPDPEPEPDTVTEAEAEAEADGDADAETEVEKTETATA